MKYFIPVLLLLLTTTFACTDSNDDTVVEENDELSVSDLTASLTENPENGESIGIVEATSGSNDLSFTIIDQTPSDAMVINLSSGELTVANKIEFEYQINPVISAVVEVSDGISTKSAAITINLIERNNVFIGDVILTTQEEVDNFGAEKYTGITGYLIVGGLDGQGITDLTPLLGLNYVDNYLIVSFNENLTSLDGLDSLLSVKTFLSINHNTSILDINGLRNLGVVGDPSFLESGNISISHNPEIKNLNGFANLNEVSGYMQIINNSSLENIDGLRNVETISHLLILENESLSNIDGVDSASAIANQITIKQNMNLTDLCGLQTALNSNDFMGIFEVEWNGYNPTQQQIISGDCSL